MFLASSSGVVDNLKACLASCETVSACRSAVFYYLSNFCSHVSTACTRTTTVKGAASFRRAFITTTTTTTTTTTPTPTTTTPTPTTTTPTTTITTIPTPAAPTTTAASSFWEVVSGGSFCHIIASGRCVSDGEGNYGSSECCTFRARRPLLLTTLLYQVERGHDFLTIDGVEYNSGKAPPQGLRLAEGAEVVWKADYSVSYAGFKVCATGEGTTIGNVPTESTMSTSSALSTKPPRSTRPPRITTTGTASSFWELISGGVFCHIVDSGICVSDGEGN